MVDDSENEKTRLIIGYFEKARKCLEDGDIDGAIEGFTDVLDMEPENVHALVNRGYAWNAKDRFDEALKDLGEAIRLEPHNASALLNRGSVWNSKGEFDKAVDDLSKAVKLEPNYVAAWVNRGTAWLGKKEYDKAIEDFNRAIHLQPSYAGAWSSRGNAWLQKKEFDKALLDHEEALRLNPTDQAIIHNRALAMAMRATEPDREKLAETLGQEYDKRLKEELEKSVGQILKDKTGFRRDYLVNMWTAVSLRVAAITILAGVAFGLYYTFTQTYHFGYGGVEKLNLTTFLSFAPYITAITTPIFFVIWLLLRWGYEAKTLSYGFYRKAILEERILLYFNNDVDRLRELQKLYIIHWMEKSPLEVMLAISGKNKGVGGGETPTESLLESLEQLTKKVKSLTDKS